MEYKDYYQILGLTKNATADAIKKSFRKLAVKYHPDKNPNDKKAEEKFKEINEAYSVIGNEENRKKYDELGENWKYHDQQQQQQQQNGYGNYQQQGQYRPEDFMGGDSQFSDFFEQMFGNGGGGYRRGNGSYRGQDLQATLQINLEDAYHGTTRQISLNNQSLNLKLKPGIADGQVLKLGGKGAPGTNGGKAGDLLLTITIAPHPVYERKGDDLYFDQPVDAFTAILGGKIPVQTIAKTIYMNIPAGTDSLKVFRLKDMGMPIYDQPGKFGAAYVRILLQSPKNLTEEQKEIIRQFIPQKAQSHA